MFFYLFDLRISYHIGSNRTSVMHLILYDILEYFSKFYYQTQNLNYVSGNV